MVEFVNWVFLVVLSAIVLLMSGLSVLGINVGLSWVSAPNSVQLLMGLIILFISVATLGTTILGAFLALKNRKNFLRKFVNVK